MEADSSDPVIRQIREQISDNDRAIVNALNRRLQLVQKIKRYKETRGLPFVDRSREEWILRDLARANRGPLSEDGVRSIFEAIFELTKEEAAKAEQAP